MMKIKFFALAALALALAACNNDNENLNGGPVAAQFTADIAPVTRASGTTWTGGDRIGITDIGNDTQYGNVPFILKNRKFEAEGKVIYFEDTKTHTFRAYYPVQRLLFSLYRHGTEQQLNQSKYRASCFNNRSCGRYTPAHATRQRQEGYQNSQSARADEL